MIKEFYFKKLIYYKSLINTWFKRDTVIFGPEIRPYQVLPLRARVELGAMAMTPPSNCFVSYHDTFWGVFYPSEEMMSVYVTVPVDQAVLGEWIFLEYFPCT